MDKSIFRRWRSETDAISETSACRAPAGLEIFSTAYPALWHGLEMLETRTLLTGLTIIAHGQASSAGTWVSSMANATAQRVTPKGDVAQYTLTVTGTDKAIFASSPVLDAGSKPWNATTSGEAIVKIDWSELTKGPLANYPTTQDIAAQVFAKLRVFSVAGLSSLSVPLHLIGHSRGASLLTELSRLLGETGNWIEQFSMLDPNNSVHAVQYNPFDRDIVPKVYENVIFADNYYQQTPGVFDVSGIHIDGAYSIRLRGLGGEGYPHEHSDTHLWYHGTIDTDGPVDDGATDEDYEQVSDDGADWYDDQQGPRENTGYYFSRVGGGYSQRPQQGLMAGFATSSGAHREKLPTGNQVWPNVAIDRANVNMPSSLAAGKKLTVPFRYADAGSSLTATVFLDRDRNPFNLGKYDLKQIPLEGKNTSPQLDVTNTYMPTILNKQGGVWYAAVRVTDPSGRIRYVYLDTPITLIPSKAVEQRLDMVFLIDTTSSMKEEIAEVKAQAVRIVDDVASKIPDFRIAVVDYRDFAYRTGDSRDYPYRKVLGFSSSKPAIVSAINSLTLGYGGDHRETVYSAMMYAIDGEELGGWRGQPVKKMLVVMGDAPGHDPEPSTGYTLRDVVLAAELADPILAFPVAIGDSSDTHEDYQKLAQETGGMYFASSSTDDIDESLLDAVTAITYSPFPEARGPYLGAVSQPLKFSASGSYDPDGSIQKYEWDWDSDGVYDYSSDVPEATHTWDDYFTGLIRMRVTDSDGLTGYDTAFVSVTDPFPVVGVTQSGREVRRVRIVRKPGKAVGSVRLQVKNTGTAPLTFRIGQIKQPFSLRQGSSQLGVPLAPGVSVPITISFSPPDAASARSTAWLKIKSNAANGPTWRIRILGRALSA